MAQYQVAKRFHRGRGLRRDLTEAARRYAEAATRHHTKALQVLNYFPPRLRTNMVRWYLLVEDRGAPAEVKTIAKFNLGICLHRAGEREEAWSWLQAAAEEGHVKAQHFHGRNMMETAERVKQEQEGMKWCEKAAERGYPPAILCLATQYRYEMAEESFDKARHWLYRLAIVQSRDAHTKEMKDTGRDLGQFMDARKEGRHIACSLVDACSRAFIATTVRTWETKLRQLSQQLEEHKNEMREAMPTDLWVQHFQGMFPEHVSRFFYHAGENEDDEENKYSYVYCLEDELDLQDEEEIDY